MINKLVFENLKHRPVRTLLGMLAIGIAVTMVLTLVGLSYGMLEESARRTRGVGADIIVRPPSSSVLSLSGAPMPEGLRKFFERLPGVAQVTGTVVQPIVIPESITGLDLDEFARMSGGLRYLSGGGFSKPDDVLIDEYYARQRKLKVGDKVELLNRDWTVSGVVEPGKLSRIFVPITTLQELTGSRGKLSQIYLKLADPAKVDEMANHLRTGIPELAGYQIYTTEQLASLISIDNIPGLKAFISVIVGLSVVIGFLVVFLAMYTAVLERTREIGILKAIGASPAWVLSVLLRETAVLAVAGSIIGIGLSFVTRFLIEAIVPASLQQKVVPEWWPLTTLVAVVSAGLGTLYPAWKAAKQDAIEALAYD